MDEELERFIIDEADHISFSLDFSSIMDVEEVDDWSWTERELYILTRGYCSH
jgi:hypothetical protein